MKLLKAAGVASALVAALHFVIIFAGAPAYRYFGAGERMARMSERGAFQPALLTLILVIIFSGWAAYAFSGAGMIGKLPLLRTSLVLIGLVYTLRGLILAPQIYLFAVGNGSAVPPRHLAFSAASLAIGLLYLAGTKATWPNLRPDVASKPRSRAV